MSEKRKTSFIKPCFDPWDIACGEVGLDLLFSLPEQEINFSQIAMGKWEPENHTRFMPPVVKLMWCAAVDLLVIDGETPTTAKQKIVEDTDFVHVRSTMGEAMARIVVITSFCKFAAAECGSSQAKMAMAALSRYYRLDGEDEAADELRDFLGLVRTIPKNRHPTREKITAYRNEMRTKLVEGC